LVFTVIADVWMMELLWYAVTIKNVKSGFISAASVLKFRKGRSGTVRIVKIVSVIHDIYVNRNIIDSGIDSIFYSVNDDIN